METINLKSFNYLEGGEIAYSTLQTIKSLEHLEPNHYDVSYERVGPEERVKLIVRNDSETVKTYNFDAKKDIDRIFNSFFDKGIKAKVQKLGFYHKVGILFYGKEGTGKTSIIKYYANLAKINHNALIFSIKDSEWYTGLSKNWNFIQSVRERHTNPIIIILDEFDVFCKDHESTIKSILDGAEAIDNCFIMAASNYIKKIPEAIKDRKSRFKYTIDIQGINDTKVISEIIKNILNKEIPKTEFEEYITHLKGKTLDEIKQFCLDKIMGLEEYTPQVKVIGFKTAS